MYDFASRPCKWVLLDNVGPLNFKNLSENCQKTASFKKNVIKLSDYFLLLLQWKTLYSSMTCCGRDANAPNPFRHDDHWAEYETRMISSLAAGAAGFASREEETTLIFCRFYRVGQLA